MSTEITKKTDELSKEIISQLVIGGDCSKMSPENKIQYMKYRCDNLGIDIAEKPFEFIKLNGKEVMYALKSCTDALCRTRKLKREVLSREKVDDVYLVCCRATDESGRYDESIGAVSVSGLKGDALCNAIMKAETKAKRRAVLSLCGLGMLDESELETIPDRSKNNNNITSHPSWDKLPSISNHESISSLGVKDEDDVPDWNITSSPETIKKVSEATKSWTHIEFPEYLTKNSEILNTFNGLQFYELSIEDAQSVYNELLEMEKKARKEESKKFIADAKIQIRNAIGIINDMKKIEDKNGTTEI